jgi:hypothetical protein
MAIDFLSWAWFFKLLLLKSLEYRGICFKQNIGFFDISVDHMAFVMKKLQGVENLLQYHC